MQGKKSDDFAGAKLALFLGPDLLVIRRDERQGIAWPGYLDLPGGGREGRESAVACVLRETHEEVGLHLVPRDLIWRRFYPGAKVPAWFFVAHLPRERLREVVFGNEGQGWRMMAPERFLTDAKAVPHFQDRLREYLTQSQG